jgi:hypothetical protein
VSNLKEIEQEIDRLLDLIVECTRASGDYSLEVLRAVNQMMDLKHLCWRLRSAPNSKILYDHAA